MIYSTLKSKKQVLNNIQNKISWNKELGIISSRNQYSLKDYEGYIENNTFTIRRILKIGANSFIPLIHGKIKEKSNDGCADIQVTLTLQKLTRIFLVGFNLFFIILIILLITTGNIINLVSLIFFILMLLSHISMNLLFKTEAKKVEAFIREVL